MITTPEYKALLMEKHDKKPWGGAGNSWIPFILPLLNRLPSDLTILDFGCGRGTFKRDITSLLPDCVVTEYDPGVRGKDKLDMSPVDYIVCTDVMEHVEEDCVDYTLRTLDFLAKWGVFFNIVCASSGSTLPDGRNTHITIKPPEWWQQKLAEFFPDMKWHNIKLTKSQLVCHGIRKTDDE